MDNRWYAQLACYNLSYYVQGLVLGSLGLNIPYLAAEANQPVVSFGILFAASGIGALLTIVLSDYFILKCIRPYQGHLLLGWALLGMSFSFALLPALASYGTKVIFIVFFSKACFGAMINLLVNRYCAWMAEDNGNDHRTTLQHSLNISFSLGTIMGPFLSHMIISLTNHVSWCYWIISILCLLAMFLSFSTECPKPFINGNGNETASLLGNEESLRKPPTLPSPLSGGIFIYVYHDAGTSNIDPHLYDPANNFLVLLGTILSTLYAGVQLGLGTWLIEYLQTFQLVSSTSISILLSMYWCSLLLGYYFFRYMATLSSSPGRVLVFQAILCFIASSILIFSTMTLSILFFGITVYGFALSTCFTNCIDLLYRNLNDSLAQRMSSMIIFGIGCGEVFIPMLMTFFMGEFDGAFGSVAVLYITFLVSIALLIVIMMLQGTITRKEERSNNLL